MEVRSAFIYNPAINVTAAQIGINKWEWICMEDANEKEAKEIMYKNKFDVLPIKSADGTFRQFFATESWNQYDKLVLREIDTTSSIYYNSSLRDLIKRFRKDQRHFYFLSDYEEVVGLVSYANLSCQPVYNYLYYTISNLETSVSQFLEHRISGKIILEFLNKNKSKFNHILSRYKKEYCIYEYLGFNDLGILIKEYQDYLNGSEKNLFLYQEKFGEIYNALRVKVMHPVKTLLTTEESVNQIAEILDDYASIMNIVKEAEKTMEQAQENVNMAAEPNSNYKANKA